MDMKRRVFFNSLFGGAAAAAAVQVAPAENQVKDISGGMALAEIKSPKGQAATKEYYLFVDPTRVDINALAEGPQLQPGQVLTDAVVTIFPVIPRSGQCVSDAVALYALEVKSEEEK